MHPTREAGVQAVRGLLLLHRCVSHQKKSLTLITTHHIGNVLGPQTIDLKLVLIVLTLIREYSFQLLLNAYAYCSIYLRTFR